MVWYIITTFLTLLFDLFSLRSKQMDQDLEYLLLRQQIRILERKLGHKPRISRWEKCLLAVIINKLLHQPRKVRQHLSRNLLIFKPETLQSWHRELVHRKWTFKRSRRMGRPATAAEVRVLIVGLAQENAWGYDKITGELLKLGYRLNRATV